MSRAFGGRSLTALPPTRISPSVISSRPATIRSALVLPQPDGPTKTMNSPSSISRSRWSTARVPSAYVLPTPAKVTPAISTSLALDAAGEALDQLLLRDEEERH